jgi:hypothetical protein
MATESAGGSERRYHASAKLRNFTAIPNEILRRPDLSGNAKALYAILLDIVSFQRDEPDLAGLGQLLGGGEKTARAAVRELEGAELLESRRRGRGMPNAYTLLEPPERQVKNGPEGGSRTAPGAEPSRGREPSSGVKTTDDPLDHPPRGVRVEGRDLGFDSLAAECEVDPKNRVRARETATALRDIREYVWDDVPADERAAMHDDPERFERRLADEIRRRAEVYRHHPRLKGATLSPPALGKWWHNLGARSRARVSDRFAHLDE